jgi:hypothetical protein
MVRDQLIKVADYKDLVLARMTTETDDMIYQTVFRFLDQATSNFLSAALASSIREEIFNYLLQNLSDLNLSNDDANRILVLKELVIAFCTT